jgi:hypothetical protein
MSAIHAEWLRTNFTGLVGNNHRRSPNVVVQQSVAFDDI